MPAFQQSRRIAREEWRPRLRSLIVAVCVLGTFGSGTTGCNLIGFALQMAIAYGPIKLMFACLPEGTEIDTPSGPRAVESLRAGDRVIGFDGEPVVVRQIHGYLEERSTVFYRITFAGGGVVDLCGAHRIDGIPARELEVGDVLPSGHRVVAIDTYDGVDRSYDLLTDDAGYRIGGVPVNSMIEEMHAAGLRLGLGLE